MVMDTSSVGEDAGSVHSEGLETKVDAGSEPDTRAGAVDAGGKKSLDVCRVRVESMSYENGIVS